MTNYNRYYNHELYDKVHNYLSSKENKPSTPSHVSFLGFQYFDLPPAPKHKYDEVHPRIFLGDGVVAQDKDQLTSMGITHLVNCCEGTKFNQVNTNQAYYDDINIKYHGIQAQDVASFRICDHFEAAVHFIDDALKEETSKLYIHCQMGVSRSATIVIAYLMAKKGMDLMHAVKHVRHRREIFPNSGFLKQLCDLNKNIYGE